MHLALELDQSKQVSADPEARHRPRAHRAPEAHRRVRRHRAGGPEGRATTGSWSSSPGIDDPAPRQGDRAAERLPRVPDHRQDRRPGEGAPRAWTGCSGGLGVQGGATPARQAVGGGAAAGRRLGAKARPKRQRRGRTRPGHRRILAALIQPARRRHRHARRPASTWCPRPRSPGGQPAQPAGGRAPAAARRRRSRWVAQPTSVGRASRYRFLYALEDKPIVTGSNLEDAQAQLDPLTNGPHRHLRARPRRRPQVRRRDRPPRRRLHGDPARRPGAGPAAGDPEPDRRGTARSRSAGQTLQEAQDLALTLKAGALPIPLKIVEERPGRRQPRRRLDPGRASPAGIVGHRCS